jgi:hypothetical protein
LERENYMRSVLLPNPSTETTTLLGEANVNKATEILNIFVSLQVNNTSKFPRNEKMKFFRCKSSAFPKQTESTEESINMAKKCLPIQPTNSNRASVGDVSKISTC